MQVEKREIKRGCDLEHTTYDPLVLIAGNSARQIEEKWKRVWGTARKCNGL